MTAQGREKGALVQRAVAVVESLGRVLHETVFVVRRTLRGGLWATQMCVRT